MERFLTMSIEQFERVADRLVRCELVRGNVIPLARCELAHSFTSANVGYLLEGHCKRVKTGRVYGNEAGLVTETRPGTVRGVDALYLSYKRLAKGKTFGSRGFLRKVPELVVEVLGRDDTWMDTEEKVAEYHKLGVDLVWVPDPNTKSVRAYPKGGKPHLFSGKDTITGGKVLPKFKCRVERFFED